MGGLKDFDYYLDNIINLDKRTGNYSKHIFNATTWNVRYNSYRKKYNVSDEYIAKIERMYRRYYYSKNKIVPDECLNYMCTNCVDCWGCINCENCSQCFDCENCTNCTNSHDLLQCKNITNDHNLMDVEK